MPKPKFGLTGLGTMGRNLALNIVDNGYDLAVHNRTNSDVDDLIASAGALAERLHGHHDMDDFVSNIAKPRTIIIMVSAGPVVDKVIEQLLPHLEQGDTIIDGGNANFHDTVRRTAELHERGVHFIGAGVSGGSEGARNGPSIMIGGDAGAYQPIEQLFLDISAKHNGKPCAAWLGPDGAGHFVKTMHNGIEYADMQMIGEIYTIMRFALNMEPEDIGSVFEQWNEGELASYLIEITGKILATDDPETGRPMVDVVADQAGQKGTGRWAAVESQVLGAPAPSIEAAVAGRAISSSKSSRVHLSQLYPADAPEGRFDIHDLGKALLAAKIIAYAQGFSVMQAASDDHEWNLPLDTVAKIWRAGCIIRSVMLDDIADAFTKREADHSLIADPDFAIRLAENLPSLRRVVSAAVRDGIPVPALATALSYFDMMRQAQSPANLIQAQRDFFGAHSFERINREGTGFHGPWAS